MWLWSGRDTHAALIRRVRSIELVHMYVHTYGARQSREGSSDYRTGEMTSEAGDQASQRPKVTPYKNGKGLGFDPLFFEKDPI